MRKFSIDFSEFLAAVGAAVQERRAVKVDIFFAVLVSDPRQSIEDIMAKCDQHERVYDEQKGWR